ncbi:T9SS type A sorting domain-containing protein [Algibacter sp.]|uniref:T9SS type A sorting domain-containing protein n=1 Tax=Algibacter sp. TaxID=1872428 RepID=UPI003C74970D
MKQSLLFSAIILFFLSPILSFSQTYKVDVRRVYNWNDELTPPDWEQQTTGQYTYDNEGDKETNILILASPGGEQLFQEKKSYDENNNIKLNIFQFWNPTAPGSWQTTAQVIYEYDGSNRLDTETTQTYVSMAWQNSSQIKYEYLNGKLWKETSLFYDSDSMTFIVTDSSTRELYEYDGSDIDKETSQHWETGTGWVDDEIFEITYTSPGVISEVIDSTWNSYTNMWEIERGTATYDMGLLAKIEYTVPDGNGGWDLDSQTLFEYVDGLLEIITDQDWDGTAWVDTDRQLNEYDGNGNNSVSTFEDGNTGAWVGYYKEVKDYSVVLPFNLSAETFDHELFKVYPNPVSDVLNISSSVPNVSMELYNVLGEKVSQALNSNQINVEGFKSGIYLLKVFNNTRSSTKKIVIK